jgi:pimeloyl-ACP methyl ester carboxylesterase
MSTYLLLHGASSDSWNWHRVAPLLEAEGHRVIAPDFPIEDDAAGFEEYARTAMDALASAGPSERPDDHELIVVAHSMAGFTAPLVCEQTSVDLLIMVAAMVPKAGESAGQWWEATGYGPAHEAQLERLGRPIDAPFDPVWTFFHDVPGPVVEEAMSRGEPVQSGTPFERPWPGQGMPDVPTRFLLCTGDRFFPADFMRRVVRERLGFAPDEIDGGHLPALARPLELVQRLELYRRELLRPHGGGLG